MPPDRIHSSRSSISLHVLSSSHPVLQQHSSVQFITSYNYQVRFPDRSLRIVILPIPQNQSFTNHATRQNPLLSFINLLARLSSSHPALQQYSSVQFITSYNYQVRFPDRPIRIVIIQTRNSKLATHGIAGNCTEFEAVSTYVTLKKITCIILRNLFGLYLFSHQSCATGTLLLRKQIYPRKSSLNLRQLLLSCYVIRRKTL